MSAGTVFLSYASQDAAAAERIALALRQAGVEVWFDQSELRGGDVWDAMIRRQIKACTLFLPIISAAAHARVEGYFRLEWKLAVDRSHLMAPEQPFLLPVVVDDTAQNDDRIPERLREIQWSRVPGGSPSAAFVERVLRLLSAARTSLQQTTPDIAHKPVSPAPQATAVAPPRRHLGLVLAVLVAVGLIAGGYLWLARPAQPKTALKAPPPAPITVAPVSGPESIAVLPLVNESGDAAQQYFSDGLSEDLITALSQLQGLRVVGRISSFRFRDSRDDSRTIGSALGVSHLLEGSVRRAGNAVRVSTELINAADGTTQWSERYDRQYRDLFALQDDITHAVAAALKTRLLTATSASAGDRPPSGNLDAYNALLQGQFSFQRDTRADTEKAIDDFTTATHLDPRYALAWSFLSRSWLSLADVFLDGTAAKQASDKARAAAATAVSIDPDLAVAHVARGLVLTNADFDQRGAEAEFRRAVELAPKDGDALFMMGNQVATLGKVEQAIELAQRALAADPLHARSHSYYSLYLVAVNRLDDAKKEALRAIELQPDGAAFHETLATVEIQRGDPKAALAAAEAEPLEVWRMVGVALAQQVGTDPAAAEASLRALIEKEASVAAYQVAEVYALRHDADKTFEWLDRAWANRDGGITTLLYDPFMARYLADPRMAAYCTKVGLPTPAQAAASVASAAAR